MLLRLILYTWENLSIRSRPCDFNGDKLVGNEKAEITTFKIKKFSGNVIWETGFMKRNLRKMCPRLTRASTTLTHKLEPPYHRVRIFSKQRHLTTDDVEEREKRTEESSSSEGDTSVRRMLIWFPFPVSRGKIQLFVSKCHVGNGKWEVSIMNPHFLLPISHISFSASHNPNFLSIVI